MSYREEEALEFIQDNDVKFVRLVFSDSFGTIKNSAVMPDYLPHVFARGATFDSEALADYKLLAGKNLRLRPDPSTLAILPWRPQTGRAARMYCDLVYEDGSEFECDGRAMLKETRQRVLKTGLNLKAGWGSEFYLFKLDDEGNPTDIPYDTASYLDIAPLDKCENVRRDICLTLEELGMSPMGSHHDQGPGQNDVWCRVCDVSRCADDILTFKTVVHTIAAQHGLCASFMPEPLVGCHKSSLHFNFVVDTSEEVNGYSSAQEAADCFAAGILRRMPDLLLILNSTTNSYGSLNALKRPVDLTNPSTAKQLIRLASKQGKTSRIEVRCGDALCNVYYAFSLLLLAGLEGLEEQLSLTDIQQSSLQLPQNMGETLELAKTSEFLKRSLPAPLLSELIAVRTEEWECYLQADDTYAFEQQTYGKRM